MKKFFLQKVADKTARMIVALMLLLVGSTAVLAGFNGQNWSVSSVDGTNSQNTTLYTLAVSSSTATPTQVSNWLPLNGQQGVMVEVSTTNYVGSYSVDVSNDQTIIHKVILDNTVATSSGGTGGETLNQEYTIAAGWKYIRANAGPISGYLAIYARVFGDDISRQIKDGTPFRGAIQLYTSANRALTPTMYQDFKVPAGARGLEIIQDLSAASSGASLYGTLYSKDPVSGKLITVVAGDTTGAGADVVGTKRIVVYPQPVQTPAAIAQTPAVSNAFQNFPVSQDMVYGLSVRGTPTTTTFSVSVKPIY